MKPGIGAAIRRRRDELKIKQAEAARRLGVDISTVSCWEAGKYGPGAENLDKVAEFLDCKLPKLLRLLHETKLVKAAAKRAKASAKRAA